MKSTLRNIFLGASPEQAAPSAGVRGISSFNVGAGAAAKMAKEDRCLESKCLDQFLTSIRGQSGLNVLDLTGLCQANVDIISGMGHRIHSDDFLRILDDCFGPPGDFYENQSDHERLNRFVEQCLAYDDWMFDGALIWDSLEYLEPDLLEMTVNHLFGLLKPSSYLLATFHTEAQNGMVPCYTYRIEGSRTLRLSHKCDRKVSRILQNRDIERLFQRFNSVKFFLTRDNLREVIVRR